MDGSAGPIFNYTTRRRHSLAIRTLFITFDKQVCADKFYGIRPKAILLVQYMDTTNYDHDYRPKSVAYLHDSAPQGIVWNIRLARGNGSTTR